MFFGAIILKYKMEREGGEQGELDSAVSGTYFCKIR